MTEKSKDEWDWRDTGKHIAELRERGESILENMDRLVGPFNRELKRRERADKLFFWAITSIAAVVAIVSYAVGIPWLTFLAAGAYFFFLCRAFVIWLNLRVDDLRDKLKSQDDCVDALERRVRELEGERKNHSLRTD